MSKKDTKGHDKKSKKDEEDDEDDEEEGTGDALEALKGIDDDEWEDTEEFEDIEKGKYQAQITSASLGTSKSSGNLQVAFECTIVSGPFKGRKAWTYFGVEDPERRVWLKSALSKLGQKWPKKASKLPGILEELEESYCEISISPRKDGDGVNMRFISALDSDDIEEDDDKDEDDDDNDDKSSKKSKKEKDEDEDDEDDKKSKKSKDEDDDDDDKKKEEERGEVTAKFDDDDLEKSDIKKIDKLADKHDFELKDYKTKTDLICDIAEYLKVSGKFKTVEALLEAIDEA